MTNKFKAVFFVTSLMVSLSPLLSFSIHINGNITSAISCIMLILVFLLEGRKANTLAISVSLLTLASAILFSLRWELPSLIFYPIYFLLSLYVTSFLSIEEKSLIVSYLSWIMLFLCIGAAVGFVYALLGGEPILKIKNPDGRESDLFLSTMTNWTAGKLIRPSGLFDEPGAFSFFICLTCAMRNLLNKDRKFTWLLLFLGFITLSVAHVIYVFFHAISEKIRIKKLFFPLIIIMFSFSIFSFNNEESKLINKYFLDRFKIENGKMAGDNRTDLMINAYNMIDESSFFFGKDHACITDIDNCNARHPPFGENILSPLALTGLFLSLPYYLIFLSIIFLGFRKRKNLYFVGVMLLLCQRPYVMSYGYSLIILLFYILALNKRCYISPSITKRKFSIYNNYSIIRAKGHLPRKQ
ncbi:hypothetical protein ABLB90_06830 [Photorhabdus bodei]|uniref:hypothetical protein n=1 Tax=Photorhabdus bodei TaxID=2029681 RepID=UPI0032B87014